MSHPSGCEKTDLADRMESSGSDAAIQYPVALVGEDRLIHVDDWDGESVVCIDCRHPMIAKRGGKRAWHFAHKAVNPNCTGEGALHHAAKLSIVEGLTRAREKGRPMQLVWPCPGCGQERHGDLRGMVERVELECSLAPGTRADIACHGARPFAIEVVVTHAPEILTLAAYRDAGVPVFHVEPTWDDLKSYLVGAVRCKGAHFVDRSKCHTCAALLVEIEEQQRALAHFRAQLGAVFRGCRPTGRTPTCFGGEAMYGEAATYAQRKEVDKVILELLSLGLRQAYGHRWAFCLTVGRGTIWVYPAGRGGINQPGQRVTPMVDAEFPDFEAWKGPVAAHEASAWLRKRSVNTLAIFDASRAAKWPGVYEWLVTGEG